MFKNNSSNKLLIIFIVLLAAAAIFIYYDLSSEVRTFKKDIVNIDTSAVTSISIYPKVTNHKEVRLFKEGKHWQVLLGNNKSAAADESKVKNLIIQLAEVKANRVAAQDENKWTEYQVDTSGTRVKIFEGNENTLDIVLGKFAFQQPRTMMSYVRVKGDKNVYEVNGFLEFAFNQEADYYRNNILVNDDFNNWKSLTFTYPADSSFRLVKDTSGYWQINNFQSDSAKTVNYLRTLSHLTGNDFVDDPDQSLLGKSDYTLTIESSESSSSGGITLSAYVDSTQFIILSSQNHDAYFNGNTNGLWHKIFVGQNYFLK